MIRATRFAAIAATAGLVVVACASFGSGDDAPADAGPDTSVVDAPGASDSASPDGPFCAPASGAAFCEDFDDPERQVWVNALVTDGGAIEITDAAFVSPPSSMHVTLVVPPDAGPGGAFRVAEVEKPMVDGFHFEAKVFPSKLDAYEVEFGFALFTEGAMDAGACSYFAKSNTDETTLYQQSPDATYTKVGLGYKLVANHWNAITIDVAGAAGSQMLTMTIDGKTAGSAPVVAPCQGSPRFDGLWVGLPGANANFPDPLEVWVDDVRVDLR